MYSLLLRRVHLQVTGPLRRRDFTDFEPKNVNKSQHVFQVDVVVDVQGSMPWHLLNMSGKLTDFFFLPNLGH